MKIAYKNLGFTILKYIFTFTFKTLKASLEISIKYQKENLKMVIQQYRAWSDYMNDEETG